MANDYQPYRAPLFRGATRPVMFLGVPLVPLIAFCTPILAAIMIGYRIVDHVLVPVVGFTLLITAVIAMREMTKRDSQYLSMWLMELRERAMLRNNRLPNGTWVVPPTPLRSRRILLDEFDDV